MVVPALWLKDIDVTSLFQLWFRPSLFPWRPWEIMKLFREVLSHLELLDKRRWGRSTKEIWGVWLYIHLQTLDITHLVHHSIHTSSLSTPTSFMTSKGIGGLRPHLVDPFATLKEDMEGTTVGCRPGWHLHHHLHPTNAIITITTTPSSFPAVMGCNYSWTLF